MSIVSPVQICPKCLCIYGFVNKFWTGRISKGFGKCVLVRIRLQVQKARNASTKFRKTTESKRFSEIFGGRRMWNNFLAEIVKYLTPPAALFDVKWNLPTFALANISHLRSKYFTAKLFHLPEGHSSLKKALARASAFFWLGWPDSDRRMQESKSCALPLGDIPMIINVCFFWPYYSTTFAVRCQVLICFFSARPIFYTSAPI